MLKTITPEDVIRVCGDDDDTAGQLAQMLGLEAAEPCQAISGKAVYVSNPDVTLDCTWTCDVEDRDWDARVIGWRVSSDYLLVCLDSDEAGRDSWSLLGIIDDDAEDLWRAMLDYADANGAGPSGDGRVRTGELRYAEGVFDDLVQ